MKVLYVTGSDYAAMEVSDSFGIEKAATLAEENGGTYTIDEENIYAELKIIQFGEVDPEFVSFINNNFIDYDQSKGKDFFILED